MSSPKRRKASRDDQLPILELTAIGDATSIQAAEGFTNLFCPLGRRLFKVQFYPSMLMYNNLLTHTHTHTHTKSNGPTCKFKRNQCCWKGYRLSHMM